MAGNSYELVGIIKVINDEQTFPSGFSKREFVVTSEEEYPQEIKFTLFKERAKLLDVMQVGERVKVSFGIRGNEYNERFYVDLNAFKVEQMDVDGSSVSFEEMGDLPEDDLPF